jgi:hypothetical protein
LTFNGEHGVISQEIELFYRFIFPYRHKIKNCGFIKPNTAIGKTE